MSTHSTVKVFENQKPLLSLYIQCDGYFEGVGETLREFLSGFKIVNGYSLGEKGKVANGMGCLAAQLAAHLKKEVGNVYITTPNDSQEYNYEIHPDGKNVTLIGSSDFGDYKSFKLYDKPVIIRKVTFVYNKDDGSAPIWRDLDVVEENKDYFMGLDNGKIKKFLKSRIVGGRVFDR